MTIEYSTQKVEFTGVMQPHLPQVDKMLEAAGHDGWRLVQVLQSTAMGTSWEALFIFSREHDG